MGRVSRGIRQCYTDSISAGVNSVPKFNILTHYKSLLHSSGAILDTMATDPDALAAFTKSHNQIADYETLRLAVGDRPESALLSLAVTEYQFGLFALGMGAYRHAFGSLRLSMELGLSSIQFSAYEIRYHRWAAGNADINWQSLVEPEEGIFSTNFIAAFFPDLKEFGRQYGAIASATYRECSEYVHGNMNTHKSLPATLLYDAATFRTWNDLAESVKLVLVFAFTARFSMFLPKDTLTNIQPVLFEHLGHLPAIQDLYN